MATLEVGKSLKDTDTLWRYLSLDKFIDLVESNTLFFTPLAWYSKTDPFEGYAPQVAINAMASISRSYRDQHLVVVDRLERTIPPNAPAEIREQLRQLRVNTEAHLPTMREIVKNIMTCTMVNCWNKSGYESEGLWGLYSRGGVAIKTSVGALRRALNSGAKTPVIHIGSVKYLDFNDPNLKPSDCLSADGHVMCMTKRIAYEHEKEVRMFITRERPENHLELLEPESARVSVDVHSMLESVVVSPFASETTERSVRAVCRWCGVNESIISRSNLLDNCEYLLDAYK
ncbi:hypothetical protein AWB69_05727 [Caballeronia udeis]|uniref:DUF2971 domain-containing protein n=1 Tax=Caballeronia udeis TaxID=1232866 RepID=A0A158IDH4_9BURK|nr:hypothetical protein [Caballeronia udeis]SAL54050.1 hypothetical protein AWB69_05727 [Caballeronia udeis]